jgi:hypothetical protein
MLIRAKTACLASVALVLCLRITAQNAPKAVCPETVSPTEPELVKPVAGWNVFFDTAPHRLSRVTFFDGPVAENASLVPDKEARAGKTKTAKWLLQPKPQRPYWLACYYSGTSLALSRALPTGLKECDVTYSNVVEIDGMPEIKSLSCN